MFSSIDTPLVAFPSNPKTIDVIALNAEGCIFNTYFYQHPECRGDVIKINLHLIQWWIKEIKKRGTELIIFTFFTKQESKQIDSNSDIKPMPFLRAVELICERTKRLLKKEGLHIPCVIDKAHLADIHDPSNLLSLYTQVQRISSIYPQTQVRYTVHDGSTLPLAPPIKVEGELSAFLNFFKANDNLILIPRKVELRFREYSGLSIKTLECDGTGEIDFYYKETFKRMVDLAGTTHNICSFFSDTANIAQLSELKQFIAEKNRVNRSKAFFAFKPNALGAIVEEKEKEEVESYTHPLTSYQS